LKGKPVAEIDMYFLQLQRHNTAVTFNILILAVRLKYASRSALEMEQKPESYSKSALVIRCVICLQKHKIIMKEKYD